MEHLNIFENLIKSNYADHQSILSENMFRERFSGDVFALRYIKMLLGGAEVRHVYNPTDDILLVWMGFNVPNQNQALN